jgi:hypothetical protein
MSKMVVQRREAKGFCAHRADLRRQIACSSQVSQTLRRQAQQRPTQLIPIDQGASDVQSLGVLGDAAIAHFGKTEDALEDQERMLDPGAHARFIAVLALLNDIDPVPVTVTPMRHVPRSRRVFSYDCALFLIGRVAPHAALPAVQQHGQRERVVHVGRACRYRVNELRAAIDPDVCRAEQKYPTLLKAGGVQGDRR